jgi:hypothetical protein
MSSKGSHVGAGMGYDAGMWIYTLYSILCSQCLVYSVQCKVYSVLFIVYSVYYLLLLILLEVCLDKRQKDVVKRPPLHWILGVQHIVVDKHRE